MQTGPSNQLPRLAVIFLLAWKGRPARSVSTAALLYSVGLHEGGLVEARECVKVSVPTAYDRHSRGLAYYVLGKKTIAEDDLADSLNRCPARPNGCLFPNLVGPASRTGRCADPGQPFSGVAVDPRSGKFRA